MVAISLARVIPGKLSSCFSLWQNSFIPLPLCSLHMCPHILYTDFNHHLIQKSPPNTHTGLTPFSLCSWHVDLWLFPLHREPWTSAPVCLVRSPSQGSASESRTSEFLACCVMTFITVNSSWGFFKVEQILLIDGWSHLECKYDFKRYWEPTLMDLEAKENTARFPWFVFPSENYSLWNSVSQKLFVFPEAVFVKCCV